MNFMLKWFPENSELKHPVTLSETVEICDKIWAIIE